MSTGGLFAVGVVVTLIVMAGLGLLVWGAILDGRDEAARRLDLESGGAATVGVAVMPTRLAAADTGPPAAQSG